MLNFKKFKEDKEGNSNLSSADVTLDSDKFHEELKKLDSNFKP